MSEKYLFRKAGPEDAENVLKLYRSVVGQPFCTWNEFYPGQEELDCDLPAGNLFLLENAEGALAGAISIVSDNELDWFEGWENRENTAEFARVVIAPAFRGNGLAKLLVQNVLDEMRARGVSATHISVAKINIPAVKTYEALGFMIRGEADMYDNHYYLCEKIL